MMNYLRKHLIIVIGTIAGAAAGYFYWKFIGCKSGTCPIKSVWYLSTLWGLVMGYLIGGIIEELILKSREKKNVNSDTSAE